MSRDGLTRQAIPCHLTIKLSVWRAANVIRRRLYPAGAEEAPGGLQAPGRQGRKDLARARSARLSRMRGRRPQREVRLALRQAREAQGRRDDHFLVDRLQVARSP